MSAESDYISSESKNILRTAKLIKGLLDKKELTKYEVIALGKPMPCRIFRTFLTSTILHFDF